MPANVEAFITALRSGSGDPMVFVDQLEDIESIGPTGHTPLGSSTFHGRPDLAEILLKRGADVNALYANGRTPLYGAMHRKDLETMRLLVDYGADVNRGIPAIGHAPLHRASYWGLLPFVQFLLSRGAEVNARTTAPNPDFGVPGEAGEETPLHYAAGFAAQDVVACLIFHGAELGIKNHNVQRPMDWALAQDRPREIVRLLDHPGAQ